ncbi:MAG: hypothetical protein Q7S22_01050 [Candidatus Micrarchaeota archaeon]|nr:hypothetical protein [Candidatus Micrarchaeota archaeon]
MEKMFSEDSVRMEFSKSLSNDLPSLSNLLYTSIGYPVKLIYPMFEARAAYSVPKNYYQPLTVAGEKHSNTFAHGTTRSLFLVGSRLMVLSKTVSNKDGKEFFTSFLLAHFEKGEYDYVWEGDNLTISFHGEKLVKNLMTEKKEKQPISFNFIGQSVKNRIVSQEDVATSSQFKSVYSKYGGASAKSASIDLEGYAITVSHFSPHPYLLQLHKELGYASNREFQEKGVLEYFKYHLLPL